MISQSIVAEKHWYPTVVGGPSKWLRTIPTRKCVGGESRVYKSKMAFIINGDKVVIVVVDLTRRKLAFVDYVFVA